MSLNRLIQQRLVYLTGTGTVVLQKALRSWLKDRRLTDEDLVIGGVGQDDGFAEQSGGVVCCGGRWNRAGERDAPARGLPCGRSSVGGGGHTGLLGFGFRAVLGGCSQEKE